MRKTKIKCGPAMFIRMCKLIRASGITRPTVCDIAFLLDCDVKDVMSDHARTESSDSARGADVPIMAMDGGFIAPEWSRDDNGKTDHGSER